MGELTVLLFWCSVLLVGYVYVGYPLLLMLLTRVYRCSHRVARIEPTVTITMAARNEAGHIESKLDSCLHLDYPRDKLEIIVGSDGSTDRTAEVVRKYASEGVRLLELPRMGKAMVNNQMVAEATGEIVIDTSASGYFEPHFVRTVVKHFADPGVGCVTGESHFQDTDTSVTSLTESTYFRYEWELRQMESDLGILCVGNGGVLAFRRGLYQPIEPSSDVDNMVPLHVVQQGYRIIHETAARTLGEMLVSSAEHQIRGRIRQVTRSQQDIFRGRALLNPFRHPKYAFVLFSRRLLRWWTPFLLILALAANFALVESTFYQVLFLAQALAYLIGAVGLIAPQALKGNRLLRLPASGLSINLAFLLGTINAARRKQIVMW